MQERLQRYGAIFGSPEPYSTPDHPPLPFRPPALLRLRTHVPPCARSPAGSPHLARGRPARRRPGRRLRHPRRSRARRARGVRGRARRPARGPAPAPLAVASRASRRPPRHGAGAAHVLHRPGLRPPATQRPPHHLADREVDLRGSGWEAGAANARELHRAASGRPVWCPGRLGSVPGLRARPGPPGLRPAAAAGGAATRRTPSSVAVAQPSELVGRAYKTASRSVADHSHPNLGRETHRPPFRRAVAQPSNSRGGRADRRHGVPERAATRARGTAAQTAAQRAVGRSHPSSRGGRADRRPGDQPPARSRTTTSRPRRDGSRTDQTGGDLLSRALAGQVPSALRGLTALFGMGRGVSLSP